MSEHWFRFVMHHLCFNDILSREQCKSLDKLAAIKDIFSLFVKNSQTAFNPSGYHTTHEQLNTFQGSCSFHHFIPSEGAKYDIKIFALVSSSNFYTSHLEVYVGVQPDQNEQKVRYSKILIY